MDWSAGAVELLTEARLADPAAPAGRRLLLRHLRHQRPRHHRGGAAARRRSRPPRNRPLPWVLTAQDPQALRDRAAALVALTPALTADTARALFASRTTFGHRAVVIAGDADELRVGLRAVADGTSDPSVVTGVAARAVPAPTWVFPATGEVDPEAVVELSETYEVFARSWSEADGEPWYRFLVALGTLWRSWGVPVGAVEASGSGAPAAEAVLSGLEQRRIR